MFYLHFSYHRDRRKIGMVKSIPQSLYHVPLLLNHIQIMEAQVAHHPTTVEKTRKKKANCKQAFYSIS